MFIKQNYIYDLAMIEQHPDWKPYFTKSVLGNEYTVLSCNGKAIMSNTEFENCTNQPLYDLVQAKVDAGITAPNILLIGWGIGFVIDPIKAIAPNADITVIEKYQEVLDLTPPPNDINIILSDIQTLDLTPVGEFDIIWSDITETPLVPSITERKEDLETKLKPDGVFKYWLSKCSCPQVDNVPN